MAIEPSTETCTKTKPGASSAPMPALQQKEIITDQYRETKIPRDEKLINSNMDLPKKLVEAKNQGRMEDESENLGS